MTLDDDALQRCQDEPIHIPGSIQPFGYLLVADSLLDRFLYASENTTLIGLPPTSLLQATPTAILGSMLVHEIRNQLSLNASASQRMSAGLFSKDGDSYEVYCHTNPQGFAVIELELAQSDTPAFSFEELRQLLTAASAQSSITKLLDVAVTGLYRLTGYDRVMAYRYMASGDGEVVAESCGPGVEQFIGLRYPKWDVPAQARALQVKNPVRTLSDIRQSPVKIRSADASLPDVDLSYAHLRGVSPVHTEYLSNMGVGASLTIGIVFDNNLWGMFSLHHLEPKALSAQTRTYCELFGQMISLTIQQKISTENALARSRADATRRRLVDQFDPQQSLFDALNIVKENLFDVVQCDGILIAEAGDLVSYGDVPSNAFINELLHHDFKDEDVIQIDSLSRFIDSSISNGPGDVAGSLIVRSQTENGAWIIFFRNAIKKEVRWAGKPIKDVGRDENGPRLVPRQSFHAYIEEHGDECEPWSDADIAAGASLRLLLLQLTSKAEELRAAELEQIIRHERQRDLLIAELNHRVKNILALIKSLSRRARQAADSVEDYANALEKRIAALAVAHDLALSDGDAGVSLRQLLESELSPHLSDENEQILLSGPEVGIRADAAPMMSLVMHELATNAAKYGSLSTPDGILKISWSIDNDTLVLVWQEMNGPAVTPPSRNGFGHTLIQRVIPYEFDGEVDASFAPEGLRLTVSLPAALATDARSTPENVPVHSVSKLRIPILDGKTGLIVEDNLILALDTEETLARFGASTIISAANAQEAIKRCNETAFDFAVLDVNLRGQTSFPVATLLMEQSIPFCFVTGYGSNIKIPDEFKYIPVLTKPIDDQILSSTLSSILKGRATS